MLIGLLCLFELDIGVSFNGIHGLVDRFDFIIFLEMPVDVSNCSRYRDKGPHKGKRFQEFRLQQ